MRGMFWLMTGAVLGILGYRYYEQNGGRLPMLEEMTGMDTRDLVGQARQAMGMARKQAEHTMDKARHEAERTVSDTTSSVARQTVAAVAEEIADAERAKQREDARRSS